MARRRRAQHNAKCDDIGKASRDLGGNGRSASRCREAAEATWGTVTRRKANRDDQSLEVWIKGATGKNRRYSIDSGGFTLRHQREWPSAVLSLLFLSAAFVGPTAIYVGVTGDAAAFIVLAGIFAIPWIGAIILWVLGKFDIGPLSDTAQLVNDGVDVADEVDDWGDDGDGDF
jgi:hypothetical protein